MVNGSVPPEDPRNIVSPVPPSLRPPPLPPAPPPPVPPAPEGDAYSTWMLSLLSAFPDGWERDMVWREITVLVITLIAKAVGVVF